MKQEQKTKCGYCGENINKKEEYAILCSSQIPLHYKCYTNIFSLEKNTFKSIKFRTKNKFLYILDRIFEIFYLKDIDKIK